MDPRALRVTIPSLVAGCALVLSGPAAPVEAQVEGSGPESASGSVGVTAEVVDMGATGARMEGIGPVTLERVGEETSVEVATTLNLSTAGSFLVEAGWGGAEPEAFGSGAHGADREGAGNNGSGGARIPLMLRTDESALDPDEAEDQEVRVRIVHH